MELVKTKPDHKGQGMYCRSSMETTFITWVKTQLQINANALSIVCIGKKKKHIRLTLLHKLKLCH